MKPRFSFIIPTINEERYIEGCLGSIKKQQLKSYEIIVVDSCSTDRTAIKAKKYTRKVVVKKCNAPEARNIGAGRAKGDILIFADADTQFDSNFLNKISAKFESNIGGGICKLALHDAKGIVDVTSYRVVNRFVELLNRMHIIITSGSCFIYRRDIFKKAGGFNPAFLTNEDHDLASRTSKIKRFMFFGDITIYTSSRRFNRMGLFGSIKIYMKSTLVFFLNNSYLKNYWST